MTNAKVRGVYWLRTGAVVLMVLGTAVAFAADNKTLEWSLRGPMAVRNLSPFSLIRMDFLPPPAGGSVEPGWDFDARITHANSFLLSPNARSYLEGRATSGPLTDADVQAILATPGDVLYFDGAVTSLDLIASYTANEKWTGYLDLPILYYSGGLLDGAIEGFHETFGFSTAGRDLVASDRYQVIIRHSGSTLVLLNSPSGLQIGDPALGVRFTSEFADQAFAIAEAAVKFPVGDVDDYVSSGGIDYGVQLSLQKQLGRHGFYFSFGNAWLGNADRFPHALRGEVPEASLAYELAFTRYSAVVLETSWSKPAFKNTTTGLSRDEFLASLGVRHWRGDVAYEFALTQNYLNYDNTLDIAATLGVSWLLPANTVE
jgi:hypothetical protein